MDEFALESLALDRLRDLGYTILHGADIAPSAPTAERTDYGQSVFFCPLRDALLPKLISGQLRALDAERFVEGAL